MNVIKDEMLGSDGLFHTTPEYRDNAFMLNATIRNGVINETNEIINGAINISATEQAVLAAIKKNA